MKMTKKQWLQHPGRNPAHRFEGRQVWDDPVFGKMRGPRNPSRWLPHQGKQEIARRLRQAEGRANG